MSTGSKRREQFLADDPPPNLSWRCWLLREHVVGAFLVFFALVAVAVGVRWVTGHTHLALLASGALALAMGQFFVPVVFELSPDGVDLWRLGRHRRIPWTAIHRYEVRSAGVLLLPFADRSALDALRGVYISWGEHREEVLFQVRYYLDQPA